MAPARQHEVDHTDHTDHTDQECIHLSGLKDSGHAMGTDSTVRGVRY